MTAWPLIGLAVFGAIVGVRVVAVRANEVFWLARRGGRSLMVRGAIAAGTERALRRVLADGADGAGGDADVRGVRRDRCTVLEIRGCHPHVEQRLRNEFAAASGARAPLGQPPIGPRNWGQRLGLCWLAFRL